MQFMEEEISEITRSVWETVLELEVRRSDSFQLQGHDRLITGCVQITGDWKGAVILDCSVNMAKEAAKIMLSIENDEEVNIEDTQDALAELVNILGGNIKSLFPGTCNLSLPTVVDGVEYQRRVPGSKQLSQITFQCNKENFMVTIVEKSKSALANFEN